jgi:hypothetical protein
VPDTGKKSKHFKKSTLEKAYFSFHDVSGFSELTTLNKLHSNHIMEDEVMFPRQ